MSKPSSFQEIPQKILAEYLKDRWEKHENNPASEVRQKKQVVDDILRNYQHHERFIILSPAHDTKFDILNAEHKFRHDHNLHQTTFFTINNLHDHWDSTKNVKGFCHDMASSGNNNACGAYTILSVIKNSKSFQNLPSVRECLTRSNIDINLDVNKLGSALVRSFASNAIRIGIENKSIEESPEVQQSLARISSENSKLVSDDFINVFKGLGISIHDICEFRSDYQTTQEVFSNHVINNLYNPESEKISKEERQELKKFCQNNSYELPDFSINLPSADIQPIENLQAIALALFNTFSEIDKLRKHSTQKDIKDKWNKVDSNKEKKDSTKKLITDFCDDHGFDTKNVPQFTALYNIRRNMKKNSVGKKSSKSDATEDFEEVKAYAVALDSILNKNQDLELYSQLMTKNHIENEKRASESRVLSFEKSMANGLCTLAGITATLQISQALTAGLMKTYGYNQSNIDAVNLGFNAVNALTSLGAVIVTTSCKNRISGKESKNAILNKRLSDMEEGRPSSSVELPSQQTTKLKNVSSVKTSSSLPSVSANGSR